MLLTLLIKARVQIAAGSSIGILFLILQTLVCFAISGGIVLAAAGQLSTPWSSAAQPELRHTTAQRT
jgi:hypothetical protein